MATKRILLIDDETGARDAMACLLADDGYVVCTAGTGRGGLERLLEFRPDTVVCDFRLPDIDGLQVLRGARAALGADSRFIILTAGCGDVGAEEAARREADAFLQKPLDLPAFRRVLEPTGASLC